MFVMLRDGSSDRDAERVMGAIRGQGLMPVYLPGVEKHVLGVFGEEQLLSKLSLKHDPAVEFVRAIVTPYNLVSRGFVAHDTVVTIGNVALGGERIVTIGRLARVGCEEIAARRVALLREAGVRILRTDARSDCGSPYQHDGPTRAQLAQMQRIARTQSLPIIAAVVDTSEIPASVAHADALVIDGWAMHNTELLRAVGTIDKPVVIKRSPAATSDQLLLAAERVVAAGNAHVVLSEGGNRRNGAAHENVLDIQSLAYLKRRCHLPVLADVSCTTASYELIWPLCKAAVACGADGLITSVCDESKHPEESSLQLAQLRAELAAVAQLVGRSL